jgi:hypothetical protein
MTANIVSVDPRTDPRWLSLACRDAASLFTSPPWLSAVCATYDFVPQARIELSPDGTAAAGAAWVEVNDLRGERRLALPFSDRADPIVSNLLTWQGLTRDIGSDSVCRSRCERWMAPFWLLMIASSSWVKLRGTRPRSVRQPTICGSG